MIRGRVWLVAPSATETTPPPPQPGSVVRDNQCRHWHRGEDGRFRTSDQRHCCSWPALHRCTDLVEVR